jgi:GGDEF domain-containing protein
VSVAEQSLLRSVIKLRRLLRDVDTVSRVGEARFGLILEGVTSRSSVTDRAARLIAAGLMPLKGLKPEVTLQFHIAAVLMDERNMERPGTGRSAGDTAQSACRRARGGRSASWSPRPRSACPWTKLDAGRLTTELAAATSPRHPAQSNA